MLCASPTVAGGWLQVRHLGPQGNGLQDGLTFAASRQMTGIVVGSCSRPAHAEELKGDLWEVAGQAGQALAQLRDQMHLVPRQCQG